ncbi:MAG: hypothetical protein IKN99_06590 [Bacteroidales bacterium]|nr:hypothetical protein [Bacteroidales bacterium]
MEREHVKRLFAQNFIGKEELNPFFKALGFGEVEIQEKPIEYSDSELQKAAESGYVLIYGVEHVKGEMITLRILREKFGVNPDISEPCFYNQDWYLKEDFMDVSLNNQWFLIKKEVVDASRAVLPEDLIQRGMNFPPAILCAYTFFAYYFARNEHLWWHDFVWCCDTDHNGDRIYVGKYHDVDGVNKNGFSIHRHLALRQCYGSVNLM